MKKLLTGLVLGSLLMASPVYAQDEGAAPEMTVEEAKAKLKELGKELNKVRKEVGVAKRKFAKNEEVVALKATMDEARKAYDAKMMELMKADADTGALATKLEEITAEMNKVKPFTKAPKKPKKPKKKPAEGGDAPAE